MKIKHISPFLHRRIFARKTMLEAFTESGRLVRGAALCPDGKVRALHSLSYTTRHCWQHYIPEDAARHTIYASIVVCKKYISGFVQVKDGALTFSLWPEYAPPFGMDWLSAPLPPTLKRCKYARRTWLVKCSKTGAVLQGVARCHDGEIRALHDITVSLTPVRHRATIHASVETSNGRIPGVARVSNGILQFKPAP